MCCPLPYRVAPVFVQVVSPPLGWSPLSSFLVIWPPSGDTRGPSVVFKSVDMSCPGPFHFSHSVDYIYDFCALPDPDVSLSILVCDVEHTSFHFITTIPSTYYVAFHMPIMSDTDKMYVRHQTNSSLILYAYSK